MTKRTADRLHPQRRRGAGTKAPGACRIEAQRKVNSPNRIELWSYIHFKQTPAAGRDVKLGLKIRSHQTISRLSLSMGGTDLDFQAESDPFPIARELGQVFPHERDERWIAYVARHNPAFRRKVLEMVIAVDNFDIPAHSFQPMPIVFAYLDEPFGSGHFLLAVSILTGVDTLGFQLPVE